MRITLIGLFLLITANVPLCSAQVPVSEGMYNIFEAYEEGMSGSQIKERLDALAEQVSGNQTSRVVLMSYGGKRSCRNEALLRARLAARYLSKVKGVKSQRLDIRNGGYRDNWTVELWIGYLGAEPPRPKRTIDKKHVTINKNCRFASTDFSVYNDGISAVRSVGECLATSRNLKWR